jgi:hypothetical protein
MIRRLFALLSVVSLLLSAATAVLWVRSYRTADLVGYRFRSTTDEGRWIDLKSLTGRFVLVLARRTTSRPAPAPEALPAKWTRQSWPAPADGAQAYWQHLSRSADWQFLGMSWSRQTLRPKAGHWSQHERSLVVPHWIPLLLFAALALLLHTLRLFALPAKPLGRRPAGESFARGGR